MKNQLVFDPRPLAPTPPVARSRPRPVLAEAVLPGSGKIEDMLQDLPEREDLQRLFERKVPIDQIVRLMGRRVDRDRIDELLGSDDPGREIRRILGFV